MLFSVWLNNLIKYPFIYNQNKMVTSTPPYLFTVWYFLFTQKPFNIMNQNDEKPIYYLITYWCIESMSLFIPLFLFITFSQEIIFLDCEIGFVTWQHLYFLFLYFWKAIYIFIFWLSSMVYIVNLRKRKKLLFLFTVFFYIIKWN